ncbi:CGNR zinc finger domain-containing protein [Kribbella sp. CA-293567]|uniref:CGNR zinc finger domain-containing protein n=1 Tax=Kribbella sp. CA-293567 TaxID=3002436 RepID=UPI0022DD7611|nr:CGNR zinc finger domain-containing protein [Kribbella sp. CA-293567]WBQ06935.1 CGNR zinc finger domain-containing protein [Kribbella sp. CA-293567]
MTETAQLAVPGVEEHPSLALVNSVTESARGHRRDELETPESVRAWLLTRDLIDPDAVLYEYCRGRIVALRESLRDLFTAHTGGDVPPPEAVQALNSALTSVPGALLLRFDATTGFTRGADHPVTQVVEHVMALIAEDAATLLTDDEASMLSSCEADGCQWFFLRTHARRQWCSIRCGDRMRAARAYARKRGQRGIS